MKHKKRVELLIKEVQQLLSKSGHMFSEEDRVLLKAILAELKEISNARTDPGPDEMLRILSLLLRFLKFFGIDDFTKLF